MSNFIRHNVKDDQQNKKFYVSYGDGSILEHCYSVVFAPDYMAARDKVWRVCGPNFAFVMDEAGFAATKHNYPMGLVKLQPSRYKC